MTPRKFRYTIRRTLWYQEDLLFEEDDCLKETIIRIRALKPGGGAFTVGNTVNMLFDRDLLETLFKVILKPYQPTFLHATWNAFWSRRNGVDMRCPLDSMTKSERGAVLRDFFIYWTEWIVGSPPSESESASSRTGTWAGFLSIMRKLFTFSRAGTLPSSTESGA